MCMDRVVVFFSFSTSSSPFNLEMPRIFSVVGSLIDGCVEIKIPLKVARLNVDWLVLVSLGFFYCFAWEISVMNKGT